MAPQVAPPVDGRVPRAPEEYGLSAFSSSVRQRGVALAEGRLAEAAPPYKVAELNAKVEMCGRPIPYFRALVRRRTTIAAAVCSSGPGPVF